MPICGMRNGWSRWVRLAVVVVVVTTLPRFLPFPVDRPFDVRLEIFIWKTDLDPFWSWQKDADDENNNEISTNQRKTLMKTKTKKW